MSEKDRGMWASRTGFILAAMGSAVGLGNIWRFPYMAYKHGGAAFLVPYLLALFVVGIPLMILEFGLGHHLKASAPLALRRIDKRFGWIGWWAVTFVMFGIVAYYAVVIAWCVGYFVLAFVRGWGDAPSKFFDTFLGRGEHFAWWILAALALVWFLNWLITFTHLQKGIERASKIFIPLLIGITAVLVFWSLTFPGSREGLRMYLFRADWSKLQDPAVWTDAFSQIFFTLSLGFGIMIAYASYLPANTNIPANALITSIGNCAYSVFAGLAVFATLGFVASSYGVDVDRLEQTSVIRAAGNEQGRALLEDLPSVQVEALSKGVTMDALAKLMPDAEVFVEEHSEALARDSLAMSGPGLVFKTYPMTLNMIPGGVLFGILFFLALVMAGLSSSVSIIEAFSSALTDHFPVSRKAAATFLCIAAFVLGIPFVMPDGVALLGVLDSLLNSYGLVTVGILESIIVGWFFTARKLRGHIDDAAGMRLSHAGDRFMRIVLTILLGLTWYGLARSGNQGDAGTTVAMLTLLGTIVLLWVEEHWLDFDVKIVIPVLLIFMLNRALAAEFAGEEAGGTLKAVGVTWLLVTVLAAFVLEEVSVNWARIRRIFKQTPTEPEEGTSGPADPDPSSRGGQAGISSEGDSHDS